MTKKYKISILIFLFLFLIFIIYPSTKYFYKKHKAKLEIKKKKDLMYNYLLDSVLVLDTLITSDKICYSIPTDKKDEILSNINNLVVKIKHKEDFNELSRTYREIIKKIKSYPVKERIVIDTIIVWENKKINTGLSGFKIKELQVGDSNIVLSSDYFYFNINIKNEDNKKIVFIFNRKVNCDLYIEEDSLKSFEQIKNKEYFIYLLQNKNKKDILLNLNFKYKKHSKSYHFKFNFNL